MINEALGIIFEKAICMLYEINFKGNFKYSMVSASKIKEKIVRFKEIIPYTLNHISANKNKYDFSYTDNNGVINYLSAKTSKKQGKICPQVIGQLSKNKFCEIFNVSTTIKDFIENSVNLLLKAYSTNTFNCPVIYYNEHKNKCIFIKIKDEIIWTEYLITFSHKNKNKKWNESSSIIIKNKTIGEFQIHKNRNCVKFRWHLENLLILFHSYFTIIEI
jgi:hypothetical protein